MRRIAKPLACLLATLYFIPNHLLCFAQQGDAQSAAPAEATLRYVPDDTLAYSRIAIGELVRDEAFSFYPTEIITAAGQEQLGFDPLLIESIDVAVGMPGVAGPAFGAIVRLEEAVPLEQLSPQLLGEGEPYEEQGITFYPTAAPMIVMHQSDDQTYFVGTAAFVASMLNADHGDSKLKTLVRAASKRRPTLMLAFDLEPLRPLIQGGLEQARGDIPPELYPHLETLGNSVNQFGMMQTGGDAPSLSLALVHGNPEDAQEVAASLDQIFDILAAMAIEAVREQAQGSEAVVAATIAYTQRIADTIRGELHPKSSGNNVVVQFKTDDSTMSVATIGVLTGLTLPAIQQARVAARRIESNSNIRQIGLSILTYEERYRKMPADITDPATGQALLSWRVAILPYMDEQSLYDQFHLDEAWDSPHNRKLLDQMPRTYRDPNTAAGNQTRYVMPSGEGLGIGGGSGAEFRDVTDGTSNTIMLVEAPSAAAVPWSAPQDAEIDMANPLAIFQEAFQSPTLGFHVLCGDGRTIFISSSFDPEVFKAMLTRSGGEPAGDF